LEGISKQVKVSMGAVVTLHGRHVGA